MGLLGSRYTDYFNGGAKHDVDKGYNQAQGYLDPYSQGGGQQFNNWNNATNRLGNQLDQYQNMGDQQWRSTQMSPQQYYQNIMNGYTQSPEAKFAQEQAQRGGNAAAAASGMMGSGAFVRGQQQSANDISQRDRGNYYNNVMGANQAQMQALNNYQGRQDSYFNQMNAQSQIGANAANQQSQNAMNHGNQQAYWDNQGFNNMAGLGAAGIKYFMG